MGRVALGQGALLGMAEGWRRAAHCSPPRWLPPSIPLLMQEFTSTPCQPFSWIWPQYRSLPQMREQPNSLCSAFCCLPLSGRVKDNHGYSAQARWSWSEWLWGTAGTLAMRPLRTPVRQTDPNLWWVQCFWPAKPPFMVPLWPAGCKQECT